MSSNLQTLVPSDKHDLDAARAAVALGWPAIKPITPQLLKWLQDMNWPVAHILAPFFETVGAELAPYVRHILDTQDEVWKYFIIQGVVAGSPEMSRALEPELRRIALRPTEAEHKEEVDLVAQEALESL